MGVTGSSPKTNTKESALMNKSELIEAIAAEADVPKAQAGRVLDAMVSVVGTALAEGQQISMVGFGTFLVRERPARSGRNPRTGDTIEIAASKTPSFKAGKALKDKVN
jgi:DNA-binding protein HU-beta